MPARGGHSTNTSITDLRVGRADGSLDYACQVVVKDARGAWLHVIGQQVDEVPHEVALPE